MIISNSDIVSMNKCEYRWYYERYKNLMPIDGYPSVMSDGTFGHKLMEEAFTILMNGGTFEEAAQAAGQIAMTGAPSEMKLYKHVLAFVQYAIDQGWKPVEIEEKGNHPINSNIEFGFTPDLVIEFTKGPWRGQQAVIDYKFTGQYWTDREISTSQQVPKYIHYKNLRDGTSIRRGAVVMLNTRANNDATGHGLFLVKWVPVTREKLKNIQRENENMMRRIHGFVVLGQTHGDEFLRSILVHTSDSKQCKMCIFADDLCPMELEGRDSSKVLSRNYKNNDHYGYNGETEGAGSVADAVNKLYGNGNGDA